MYVVYIIDHIRHLLDESKKPKRHLKRNGGSNLNAGHYSSLNADDTNFKLNFLLQEFKILNDARVPYSSAAAGKFQVQE